jgi:hypothetical protein
MAKILQFPDIRDKTRIEKEMTDMQHHLTELYDAIRKVEIGLGMLQKQSEEIEDTYQELIQGYADIVGSDNIDDNWLEFCTYVSMERDPTTGDINISFKPPEEEPENE